MNEQVIAIKLMVGERYDENISDDKAEDLEMCMLMNGCSLDEAVRIVGLQDILSNDND